MLKNVLYSKISKLWWIDVASRFYAFNLDFIKAKRRKLQIEEIEAQIVDVDKSDSNWDENSIRRLNLTTIEVNILTLFKSFSSYSWMKYLERFVNYRLQRSKISMKYIRAFRLLQIMTTFVCLEHFVVLKKIVAHYRVLVLKEVIQASLDLSSHLYTIDV